MNGWGPRWRIVASAGRESNPGWCAMGRKRDAEASSARAREATAGTTSAASRATSALISAPLGVIAGVGAPHTGAGHNSAIWVKTLAGASVLVSTAVAVGTVRSPRNDAVSSGFSHCGVALSDIFCWSVVTGADEHGVSGG